MSGFETAANTLEQELRLFFQQEQVKSRVRDWIEQKVELNPRTLSYLENKADYPDVSSLALFDQHLSGLELTQAIEPEALLDLIGDGVWDKPALIKAIHEFFNRFGPRVAVRRPMPPARKDLVAWCCEQALRLGCALPAGFSVAEHTLMAGLIQPQWVSEACLTALESIGLNESAIQRILDLVLNGAVSIPGKPPQTGPFAVAMELLRPKQPVSVEDLAAQAQLLYGQHERFLKLRPQPWLSRLQQLAESKFPEMPPGLEQLLQKHTGSHWIVVDCLGLPLLGTVRPMLADAFAGWTIREVEFGLVSEQTSTEAFYLGLIGRDFRKAFEKINSVDALIHGRKLTFDELRRLCSAELEIAFRKLKPGLDPASPLVIFGDHGFRLAPDGAGFAHGGPTTLERIVPIFVLDPR